MSITSAMKCTKQQKVLGGVMVVGLILVGLDRLTSHPSSADAAVVTSPSEFAVDRSPAATTVANSTRIVPLSTRLRAETTLQDSDARGAFDLAPMWQTPEKPVAVVVDPAIENFTSAHHLSTTLVRGDRSGAIIDGKLCVVGQTLDGFKLLSVTGRTATFANSHGRATLCEKSR